MIQHGDDERGHGRTLNRFTICRRTITTIIVRALALASEVTQRSKERER